MLEWNGLRIGLFDGQPGVENEGLVSFHGAISHLQTSTMRGEPYARVEIFDCPELRLERPGLSTVIQTPFSDEMLYVVRKGLERRRATNEATPA